MAISPDSYVLRRAHKSQAGRRSFAPNKNDTDGVSLYLEGSEVTPNTVRNGARKPPEEYDVLRIPVRAITELGLSVQLKDDEENPGHCVIPELTYQACQDDRERTKEMQAKLFAASEHCE